MYIAVSVWWRDVFVDTKDCFVFLNFKLMKSRSVIAFLWISQHLSQHPIFWGVFDKGMGKLAKEWLSSRVLKVQNIFGIFFSIYPAIKLLSHIKSWDNIIKKIQNCNSNFIMVKVLNTSNKLYVITFRIDLRIHLEYVLKYSPALGFLKK